MDPDAEKRSLRAEMRRRRAAIVDRSARLDTMWPAVIERCRVLDARTVMAFLGVGSEPDTGPLLALLGEEGITVVLPRVVGARIEAVVHRGEEPMDAGPLGIPNPRGPEFDPTAIDVVVVPGLAFTLYGRRLGQGGGYYDRFLPLLDARATTIGVCFREQIVDDLPIEAHDRTVDVVVTA